MLTRMFAWMRGELDRAGETVAAVISAWDRRVAEGEDVSGAQARALLERAGRVRRLVDALIIGLTAELREAAGEREATEAAARVTGTSSGEAERLVSLAGGLEGLSATRDALAQGQVSVAQAAVIAETTSAIHATGDGATTATAVEARLVNTATTQGLEVLRREATEARAAVEDPAARARRQWEARSLRCWTDVDGMVAGRFRLSPEVGAQVRAILEDHTRRIFRARAGAAREPIEACAADALVELVGGAISPTTAAEETPPRRGRADGAADGATGGGPARAVTPGVKPVVHIVVDHAALVRGATSDGERCEIPGVGPVDPGWVRELLGDAFLTAVIRKGRDIRTVAHLGRRVPAELRSALVAAGRECDVEGCARASYLELDHCEIDHARGGPTSYDNLTWLCWEHHRRKTRGARLGPRNPQTGKRPLLTGLAGGHDPPERAGSR